MTVTIDSTSIAYRIIILFHFRLSGVACHSDNCNEYFTSILWSYVY